MKSDKALFHCNKKAYYIEMNNTFISFRFQLMKFE